MMTRNEDNDTFDKQPKLAIRRDTNGRTKNKNN